MLMERALVKKNDQIDRVAIVEAYDAYNRQLYYYAYRLLGQADLAEECVAETFSRLLHSIHNGNGPRENLKAYLYRIAHNWVTDYYRRQPEVVLSPELVDSTEAGPAAQAAARIDEQRVRAALLRLTPDQQQVIVLRFLENWSHQQIASMLQKSPEAIRVLQHRALATLRALLKEKE